MILVDPRRAIQQHQEQHQQALKLEQNLQQQQRLLDQREQDLEQREAMLRRILNRMDEIVERVAQSPDEEREPPTARPREATNSANQREERVTALQAFERRAEEAPSAFADVSWSCDLHGSQPNPLVRKNGRTACPACGLFLRKIE